MAERNVALIVGGSNGIGMALAHNLANKEYKIIIIDVVEPEWDLGEVYTFIKQDLRYMNISVYEDLAMKEEINVLFISAGFGNVAKFEDLHNVEIANLIKVNELAPIQIIKAFYKRISTSDDFFVGIMGSIAGFISSPMFSVYAASKAAVCRFVESINAELIVDGFDNRILNVSPGSLQGTKFNGFNNDERLVTKLVSEIVELIFSREELFIPEYSEIYKNVLQKYNTNPRKFGEDSYRYKVDSGRTEAKNRIRVGYLSGTFDLFHVGHLNLIKRAKSKCDYLIVGVHKDASHKGKETFIPFEERKVIIESISYVDKVVESCSEDSDAWDLWHFNYLFVGSDYRGTERFMRYEEYFKGKDVEIVFFPYTKSTSSTQIRHIIDFK